MENIDAPDVLPVILGGDIGAYSLARAFHEAYGIVPLVFSQADCHMCGDSSILVNRVVPHLERPAVLLSTLANTAECFGNRPLLLLGCGDWYVRLIVENRAVLEKSFIIPYIGEDLLNRLTEKDRFYELCAEVAARAAHRGVRCPHGRRRPGRPRASLLLPRGGQARFLGGLPLRRFPREAEGVLPARRDGASGDACGRAEQPLRGEAPHPGDDPRRRHEHAHPHHLLRSDGKVRFASFGQTLLEDMRPMGVGNPLAIVSRTDETIVTEAARLLEAVGYTGFANFDIKVDPRDGSHYFFEINTRLGRSNYYVTAAGDNVARWLMDDLVLGRPLPEGLTVARGESLYTVVPKAILLDYIRDDALRREVRGLYALGRDADPLDYPAEKSLRRRLYPLVFAFRQWKTCRAAMADKRAREKAAEGLEGAGATANHRTKGTASGKDDEHVASASPELPLADGLAACAKAAS